MIWFILAVLVIGIAGVARQTLFGAIAILFLIATSVFFWGVIKFIFHSDNETERNKAKSIMTYGIVGLAVMASAWGIATIIVEYLVGGGSGIGPERGTIPKAPGKL